MVLFKKGYSENNLITHYRGHVKIALFYIEANYFGLFLVNRNEINNKNNTFKNDPHFVES